VGQELLDLQAKRDIEPVHDPFADRGAWFGLSDGVSPTEGIHMHERDHRAVLIDRGNRRTQVIHLVTGEHP